MSKPLTNVSAYSSNQLGSELSINSKNLFSFEDKKIAPVELATFHTINFAEEGCSNAILFSTRLSACAAVIIKNKGESGRYDNVVTMAHFYPANAIYNDQAADNMSKIFDDFEAHGGRINNDTSVILLGGGIFPGEDLMSTTPTGTLFDCLQGNQSALGYKFTHHKTSISDLTVADGKYNGSMAYVNRDGTSILRTTFSRESGVASFYPLTKEIESMPIELLTRIGKSNFEDLLYPKEITPLIRKRTDDIVSKMSESDVKPMIPIEKSTDLLKKILQPTISNYR